MLRFVAYSHAGVQRFPVPRTSAVIGSDSDCEICIQQAGIAARHAQLSWDGDELRISDLGSRRGLVVNGRRVEEAGLQVLDEIKLGGTTLLLEDVGISEGPEPAAPVAVPEVPTVDAERLSAHVAALSDWVLGDTESRATAESLLGELLKDFGGGALFLLQFEGESHGIRLVAATDPAWLAMGGELMDQAHVQRKRPKARHEVGSFEGRLGKERAWIFFRYFSGLERSHLLLAALPRFREGTWSPMPYLRAVADMLVLGLVHHVGRYEPLLPGHGRQLELRLAPGVIVGESAAMKRLMDQLRAAIEPEVTVLLRGESGSGREHIARTLHLSGPRAAQPFVVASCLGVAGALLEAELFGVEAPRKGRDVVRSEGKLQQADGGTLYISEVEHLPLDLQARLVRFLRSGEVEPVGGFAVRQVDVRLIASSRTALEPRAARDAFRIDLAHRLSRFAFDVPPLRARREDLPLLIQAYVNRFCHEAGKRVHGISVKAMAALTGYLYPGNLPELENVIRQLVYVCPAGQPIRHSMLPERLRIAAIEAAGRVPDPSADIRLDRLVAACEEAAIREALRRTEGNKLHAARLLGISRNGLAMKMERYRI
jgi:DNA-binding NtrC family response regulator/pSer/pThr/pTyr-binding forkhead associated (FHA) protein